MASANSQKPWCIIKCLTAEREQDFEIIYDDPINLNELNKFVQRRCGENYRCYILRGSGTLKKLRRDCELQDLVSECNYELELYVKRSRTLSVPSAKQPLRPPISLSFEEPSQTQINYSPKYLSIPNKRFSRELSVQPKPAFKKGHRRTKSAHASFNQNQQNLYIPEQPEPHSRTPDLSSPTSFSLFNEPSISSPTGGRFVPDDRIITPDSGFQSPDYAYSTQSSLSADTSTLSTPGPLYEGELPRHLLEEFPGTEGIDAAPESSNRDDVRKNSVVESIRYMPTLDASELLFNAEILPDNYLVKKMIGSGGFAKVYQCTDVDTGQDFALKQVLYDLDCEDSQKELRALKNEIDILKKLSHPNIVVYYGSAYRDSYFNILMEYVSGGSMRAFIQQNGPLSNKYATKCMFHIITGLSYLHEKNIIHRDLKAANVLKTTDGLIKIADFGASKQFDTLRSISGANTVVGTPYWMAPEVIRAQSYSIKVDMWGVGVTAFEFLSGKPPFFQLEPLAAMFKIAQKQMKNELIFPNEVNKLLKKFILSCLEQEPRNRPSAEEVLRSTLFTHY